MLTLLCSNWPLGLTPLIRLTEASAFAPSLLPWAGGRVEQEPLQGTSPTPTVLRLSPSFSLQPHTFCHGRSLCLAGSSPLHYQRYTGLRSGLVPPPSLLLG